MVAEAVAQRVHAGEEIYPVPRPLRHQAIKIAGIGDKHIAGTDREHGEHVHRQREDMVERERGHERDRVYPEMR